MPTGGLEEGTGPLLGAVCQGPRLGRGKVGWSYLAGHCDRAACTRAALAARPLDSNSHNF